MSKVYKKPVLFIVFFTTLVLFSDFDYHSRITEEPSLPYFDRIDDTKLLKRLFFKFMHPIIELENDLVLKQRKQFLRLYQKWIRGERLLSWEMSLFERFAELYFVNTQKYDIYMIFELLKRRIDIVPIELALAQSANESAWGRSRFATEGNAMFGQWSFSKKNPGMVPKNRDPNAKHMVAKFPSIRASVKSYIKNLNTHSAYLAFRILRSQTREEGVELDGQTLASGLINYSERRKLYVNEIRAIMKINKSLMNLD